jgi:dihydroflavonol-4-reductase
VRAAVTGANGFIGRNLVKALLREGHEVLSIIRREEKAPMLQSVGSEVEVLELFQEHRLASALKGVETLFHLANVMVFATRRQQWRTNVLNMRRVLRAARKAGVEGLVYTSSVAVYGDTGDEWATEDTPRRPTTYYGMTKLWAENIIAEEAGDLSWTVLRPGLVYGPGSSLLYHTIKRGPVILGSGSNWLPLVHVVDVSAALMEAAKRAMPKRTFNVVDDRPMRLSEFLGVIAREAGVGLRRGSYQGGLLLGVFAEAIANVRGGVPKLTRDVLRLYGTSIRVSNGRIKEKLGFRFTFPDPWAGLPEAIARVSDTFAI